MEASMYPDGLRRHGIDVVIPDEDDRVFIHQHDAEEMIKGVFRDDVRERVIAAPVAFTKRKTWMQSWSNCANGVTEKARRASSAV